jgi:hypothetical protein
MDVGSVHGRLLPPLVDDALITLLAEPLVDLLLVKLCRGVIDEDEDDEEGEFCKLLFV